MIFGTDILSVLFFVRFFPHVRIYLYNNLYNGINTFWEEFIWQSMKERLARESIQSL